MKITVTRKLPQKAMDRLATCGDLWVWPHDRDMTRQELLQEAPKGDILVPLTSNPIDAEVMDAFPDLKLIANYAVGYNNIDIDAAKARKITVTNTPGVLTESTADMTMGLILDAGRRITEGDRLVRRGGFKNVHPEFHLGWDLTGKTLGIYGFGRIGLSVARRAHPFHLKVIYHNRTPRTDLPPDIPAEYVSFSELLERSDFLSVNAPLTEETRHRFTMTEFKAMKPSSIFINMGRGPIVKESDLAQALGQKEIAAAGLDVYEFEPQVDPRLIQLENVVLAPHLGSATLEVRTQMGLLVAENVEAFTQGRVVPYKVV